MHVCFSNAIGKHHPNIWKSSVVSAERTGISGGCAPNNAAVVITSTSVRRKDYASCSSASTTVN